MVVALGGGDLVEFFDLHQINPRHKFRPPQSRTRARTLSSCVLGVRLNNHPRHDKPMMTARSDAGLTHNISAFLFFRIFNN
jgi:hypothetical protein